MESTLLVVGLIIFVIIFAIIFIGFFVAGVGLLGRYQPTIQPGLTTYN
jgi:hypothetical protein